MALQPPACPPLPPTPCRYTAFIPLYPLGVACEMALMWLALPLLASDGRWSIRLPNAANYAFDYAVFIRVRGGVSVLATAVHCYTECFGVLLGTG